jgi:transposase
MKVASTIIPTAGIYDSDVIGVRGLPSILLSDSFAEEVGMALAITRTDLSAEDLRGQARRAQDGDQACRLVALALVLEGACRMAAARAGGMDRQTLRDWVIRYNEAGVDGLRDRPRSGRRPRLNAEQLAELARLVEEGPDVAVHGVVRWRCIDLQAEIKARFAVELSERHIGRLLGQLKFTRLSVRPRHPQADEAAQQAFKKTSPPG